MQICVKPFSSQFAFILHSAKVQPPTSGLWLAADRHFSVMALDCAGINQVGVIEIFWYAARMSLRSTRVKVRSCFH